MPSYLQSSGAISLNDVNVHLLRSSGAYIQMNDTSLRQLAAGYGTAGVGNPFPMSYLYGATSARYLAPSYPPSLYFRTRDNGYDGNWAGETHWTPGGGTYLSDSIDYNLNFNGGLDPNWSVDTNLTISFRFRKTIAGSTALTINQIVVYIARSDLNVVSNPGICSTSFLFSDATYNYYSAEVSQSLASWGTNSSELARSDTIVSIYVEGYAFNTGYIFYIGGGTDITASLTARIL